MPEVPETAVVALARSRWEALNLAGDWADVGSERRERLLDAARRNLWAVEDAIPALQVKAAEEVRERLSAEIEDLIALAESAPTADLGSPLPRATLSQIPGLRKAQALLDHALPSKGTEECTNSHRYVDGKKIPCPDCLRSKGEER